MAYKNPDQVRQRHQIRLNKEEWRIFKKYRLLDTLRALIRDYLISEKKLILVDNERKKQND